MGTITTTRAAGLLRRGLWASALLCVAGAAHAQVSATATVVNDYDFRGFSQSARDPALQGSLDYSHASGFYAGGWASNVDFDNDIDYEVDLYAGFTNELASGVTYDVGLVQYAYPDESDANYLEIYGGVARDWFDGKLWYSPDFGGDTTPGDTEGWYLEGNGTFPLPQGFSLLTDLGYSTGDYWDDINGDDVLDYSLGLGYTLNNFELSLKYVDTESDVEVTSDVFNNEGRVIFGLATTFPWGQ